MAELYALSEIACKSKRGLLVQVVDEDLETGMQTRRFLAYDVMLINGKPCVQLPFEVCCVITSHTGKESQRAKSALHK